MNPLQGRGGDRSALSGVLTSVAFAVGVGGANARAQGAYPRPWANPEQVRDYFTTNADAARLSAAGQLLSAVSLLAFTRSAARLATRAGSASARVAAVSGGTIAAGALTGSALCTAALSGPAGHDAATAAKLHRRGFQIGGPIHGVGFGLLCASVGWAGLKTGELSRPAAMTALGSTAANIMSPLYFLARPFGWLIPAGRFPGLVAIGLAGARLGGRA